MIFQIDDPIKILLLVFYNTILKCYIIIDLKSGKLVHQDIGQVQMYVNFYDREIKQSDDNPTVGLVLCEDKKDAVVRYTLSKDNRQIFASKYKLYLPTEAELIRELKRERALIETGKKDKNSNLDVKSIKSKITAKEIVGFVRESRKR